MTEHETLIDDMKRKQKLDLFPERTLFYWEP